MGGIFRVFGGKELVVIKIFGSCSFYMGFWEL